MRRIGRFSIDAGLVRSADEAALRNLLAGCLVLQAQHRADTDRIEYVALHDQFDLIKPGDEAPHYEARFAKHTGSVLWRRK